MKYTIHGFSQSVAIKLKLDNDDLLLLRWLVDFSATNKMKTIVIDDKPYYWVYYETICEELPIISLKKDTIYRKIKKMVDCSVLTQHTKRDKSGTFSYYAFGSEYSTLISDSDPLGKISEGGTDENPNGVRKKIPTKDSSTKLNLSTKKTTTKEPVVDSISKEVIQEYRTKINTTINDDVSEKAVNELIQEHGMEKINKYLDNWKSFDLSQIKSNSAFFIAAVKDGYAIPAQKYTNDNRSNFRERDYNFDNSIYANCKQ